MLLANFRGTPEAAVHALEHAAQLVLDAHIHKLGNLIESKNQPVKVHLRDLEQFKEMLHKGHIGTLQQGHQGYWSHEKWQGHALKSVQGGGCKVGPMAGQVREDFTLKCVQGGGCKVGHMGSDQAFEDYKLKIEQGGGCKVGKMAGQALEDNCALISQSAKDSLELLLKVANGVAGDSEKWKCDASRVGNAVHYRFLTNRTSRKPILGVRKFEQFVLDDLNGFGAVSLTQEGAEALRTLKAKKKKAHQKAKQKEDKAKRG
jgi:hypothetical protein